NEFVYVIELRWQAGWGDALDLVPRLKAKPKPEVIDLVWLTLDEILATYPQWDGVNVALRLMMGRYNRMIPVRFHVSTQTLK
ncbi:MAG: hypothetical protein ACE5G1_10545, partial [bacterium]